MEELGKVCQSQPAIPWSMRTNFFSMAYLGNTDTFAHAQNLTSFPVFQLERKWKTQGRYKVCASHLSSDIMLS